MSSSPSSRSDASRTFRPVVSRASLVRLCLVGALLTGSALLYACDTVARIAFPTRTLSETHTAGLTLPSNACADPEAAGQVQLRFAFVDSTDAPIRPPDKGGSALTSGRVELTGEDLEFENSAVFESPDLVCGMGTGVPDYAVQCNVSNYSCNEPPAVDPPDDVNADRCFVGQNFSTDNQEVSFASNVEQDQLFGVMVENSGSTGGFAPTELYEAFDAYDPHENAEGNMDPRSADMNLGVGSGRNSNLASDRDGIRHNAMQGMVENWKNAQDAAENDGRATRFGLWGIASSSTPTSYVNSVTGSGTFWTGSDSTVESAQDELQGADVGNEGANIFESLNSVVTNHFSDSNCPSGGGCEKTLVLIVDGPSDVPLRDLRGSGPNVGGVTFDTVRQSLEDAGVRLFVVHYDPDFNIDTEDPSSQNYLTLDNPGYYGPQTECSSDSDCHHFQECRKVDGYASSTGENVSSPNNPHGTYCVPERGPEGRIGSIGLYSRLACATEGAYIYRKSNTALEPAAEWLPYSMDGLWEVSVPVETFGGGGTGGGQFTRGETIKLQTEISYDVNDSTVQSRLTQQGNNLQQFDARDTRSVIMTSESDQ